MASNATAGLHRYREARAEAKATAVKTATVEMLDAGVDVTIGAVARHANVSRAFIHAHDDLHQCVRRAAEEHRQKTGLSARDSVMTSEMQSRVAERLTYVSKIEEAKRTIAGLREELATLQKERARWLGGRLEILTGPPLDTLALQESLTEALDERDKFRNEAMIATKRAERLQRDLSASRRAHREDIAERTALPENVVPLMQPEPPS